MRAKWTARPQHPQNQVPDPQGDECPRQAGPRQDRKTHPPTHKPENGQG